MIPLPLRLVLDTNVWLDWLVFDDAAIAPIRAAVASGKAQIFIGAACAQELARVLAYELGKIALDADAQAACLAECRRVARMAKTGERESGRAGEDGRLPVCHDPDDQKFLELARDCCADYLVTKDRELLVLARRRLRPVPFSIVTPRQINDTLRAE